MNLFRVGKIQHWHSLQGQLLKMHQQLKQTLFILGWLEDWLPRQFYTKTARILAAHRSTLLESKATICPLVLHLDPVKDKKQANSKCVRDDISANVHYTSYVHCMNELRLQLKSLFNPHRINLQVKYMRVDAESSQPRTFAQKIGQRMFSYLTLQSVNFGSAKPSRVLLLHT